MDASHVSELVLVELQPDLSGVPGEMRASPNFATEFLTCEIADFTGSYPGVMRQSTTIACAIFCQIGPAVM